MYENLIKTIVSVNDQITNMKPVFAKFIADQEVPLKLRWLTFVKANDALKCHELYCTSFDALPDDFLIYEGPYHVERNQTYTTADLIQTIEDNIADNNDPENAEFVDAKEKALYESIDVDALKEEILASNTGSFTYDW